MNATVQHLQETGMALRDALDKQDWAAIGELDLQGLSPFQLVEGTLGSDARAIGGASLPLLANYAVDREVLLRALT